MPKSFISTLWQLLDRFHPRIYRLTGVIILCEILKLAPAAALAVIVNHLTGGLQAADTTLLLWIIGGLFVASSLVSLLDIQIEYASISIGFDAEVDVLKRVSRKLLSLPLGYHESRNTGSLVHVLHKGSFQMVELIYFTCKEMIPTTLQLSITLIVLLWVNWMAGLLFLLFIPIFVFLIHRYGSRVQHLRHAYHGKLEEAAGSIGERVANVRTVQDYAVQERELDSYDLLLQDYLTLQRKRIDFQKIYYVYRDIALNVGRVCIMSLGIFLVTRGYMTAGALVFFITATEKANLSLFRMTNLYNRAGDSMEAITRLADVLKEEETITEAPDAVPVTDPQGHIAFKDVKFAYDGKNNVLKGVSFGIQPKKMLAVVGRSGSGKSTLVKLLYRHFDVGDGAIEVDGTDIRRYKLAEYRRLFASVPQDIEIFNATIRDNIAFGALEDVTDEEVEKAARIAHAHDFIEEFPAGYKTLVGERGVRLSGGQKQRIGIARALLTKPAILIFDEATSSLDTESEQLIQKAMWNIAKDFTMIVIAHRLSTIEHADTVMVMDNGTIAEIGTHEDLMAQRGLYQKMRQLQHLGDVRE